MREYEHATISGDSELNNFIHFMRRYGWVYVDSNMVNVPNFQVSGHVVDGYGYVVGDTTNRLLVDVRFVRDTRMPHYQEVHDLYNEYQELLKEGDKIVAPRARGLAAFIVFTCISAMQLAISFSSLSSGNISAAMAPIILSFLIFSLFLALLIVRANGYGKASDAYNKGMGEFNKKIKKHYEEVDDLYSTKEIRDFLDDFEDRLDN